MAYLPQTGQRMKLFLNKLNNYIIIAKEKKKLSYDTNDFDISFIRGLSLEDGVTTLTDFTASIIGEELSLSLINSKEKIRNVLLCGGGRKNKVLLEKIVKNSSKEINFNLIDNYKINGDFIESQGFAFLAIRSVLNLPITFPNTTGCKKICTGGKLIQN